MEARGRPTLVNKVFHIGNQSRVEKLLVIDLSISSTFAEKVLECLDVLDEHWDSDLIKCNGHFDFAWFCR